MASFGVLATLGVSVDYHSGEYVASERTLTRRPEQEDVSRGCTKIVGLDFQHIS